MILETKVMAKIALLVGATWIVNSFVIGAVLLMILASEFRSSQEGERPSSARVRRSYFGTGMRLGVQNWQPTSRICTHEKPIFSLFLLVIPIFFAAITFAKVLQQRTQASAVPQHCCSGWNPVIPPITLFLVRA